MTIQWYNGHILWVDGHIAHHADCCCDTIATTCPDCDECDSAIDVNISGFTTTGNCWNLHGDYELAKTCTGDDFTKYEYDVTTTVFGRDRRTWIQITCTTNSIETYLVLVARFWFDITDSAIADVEFTGSPSFTDPCDFTGTYDLTGDCTEFGSPEYGGEMVIS